MPALTKAGMQGSMARPAPCPLAGEEPRGPGLLLAGLCVLCGLSTIHRDAAARTLDSAVRDCRERHR